MAFPKDLRQRMINLMYLVLMAMLAINIDPSALNGYITINEGMGLSYEAFNVKNQATLNAIKAKAEEEDKEEYKELAQKAEQLSGVSTDLDDFINTTIRDVQAESHGTLDSKDPADVLMISSDIETGRAAQLKRKITETLNEYKAIVNASSLSDAAKQELIGNFALRAPNDAAVKAREDNKDNLGWAQWTFQGKPAIAVEAMLNQFKNDAKATEGQILDKFALAQNIKEEDKVAIVEVADYNLGVTPQSTVINPGQTFRAKVNVGQNSTANQKISIFYNGRALPIGRDGFAVLEDSARGIGKHKIDGLYAEVTNPNTGKKTRVNLENTVSYEVVKADKTKVESPDATPVPVTEDKKLDKKATVSAEKMNVFYAGLTNPVKVAATGLGTVNASCSGCSSFAPDGSGGYNAKVPASMIGKTVNVNVTIGGTPAGAKEFRVLKVPDPVSKLGVKRSGSVFTTGEIATQSFVQADLENFVFDAKFQVLSYDIYFLTAKGNKRVRGTGNQVSPEIKNYFTKVGPGAQIVLTNMKVKGPDGTTRTIPPAVYAIR